MGRRVSVRRVVERSAEGRLLFGDVVGELVGLDAQTAVLDTRSGLVEVPVPYVAAARLVPASTADELALDAVAARGLRPAETGELGGWLLRADDGTVRRANSVLPRRQLGMPLDDALAQARQWYADRGLPLLIGVQAEARRLLDAELGERGWNPVGESHVMATTLRSTTADVPRDTAAGVAVELTATPDDDWLALYRGGAAATAAGLALLTRHDRVVFARVRVDGRTVAVARGAVDEHWLGVMAVEVAPQHRRRGLARAVTARLWEWGREQGATRSYLQVEAANTAAVTLYERLGYWVHHDYRYREDPETTR
ncbi:Acetyltransferase (GNAT) family protein [Jatrophihabitans endophyticus]|uniref:Acetyltransferase (GNAT) family protein n=1 Tax=Jatrophihabitans endophyticus TaxID=1206085 RepID=A0A1M5T9R6_9ACTN|nr:Acetyltransferase (GNAT) family protein [Jatrophihabitans endophyticus]